MRMQNHPRSLSRTRFHSKDSGGNIIKARRSLSPVYKMKLSNYYPPLSLSPLSLSLPVFIHLAPNSEYALCVCMRAALGRFSNLICLIKYAHRSNETHLSRSLGASSGCTSPIAIVRRRWLKSPDWHFMWLKGHARLIYIWSAARESS